MRGLVACLLLASLLLLPPAAAQAHGKLQTQLLGKTDDPEATFKSGRVAPMTDVNLGRYDFGVQPPFLSYCADANIRMEYQVKAAPPVRVLQPEDQTRQWHGTAGLPVSLQAESTVGVYSADVRAWVDETAVAFTSHEVALLAQAVPAAAFPACSFTASDPMKVSTVFIVDYVPKLHAQAPPSPWLDAAFLLDVENLGNGDSRIAFAFGTTRGEWVPLGVTHVLETPLLPNAVSKNRFSLNRLDAPLDWTGEVIVSMTSIQTTTDVAKAQVIVDLGAPPPLKYPQESEHSEDVIEDVPGWGGLGTALALGLGLFVRRRRLL